MAIVRVLLIVGVLGGLTAWAVAQSTTTPTPTPAPAAPRPPTRTAAPAVSAASEPWRATMFDVEISRLRDGLDEMPAPQPSSRNPFRFGTPAQHAAVASAHRRATVAPPEQAVGTVGADRPPMQLLGVAAEEGDAAPVRTAVIATPRQLYLVREGEQIALRFQVVRIGADAVELRDLVNDETFPLVLH